ncbi:MAG TPA: hypothetical protein VFY48_02510 [Solirubrobacterales bacterium]|nr:hypothetical protein [Solirubrobacterales bacterium]
MLVALVLGAAVGTAVAAAPGGPRLAVLEAGREPADWRIATIAPDGDGYRRIAALAGPDPGEVLSLPAWSPDGESIAFGSTLDGTWALYIVPARGGEVGFVWGTKGGDYPVFSPDGRSLAFARHRTEARPGRPHWDPFESTSVWIVDFGAERPRQLTRWHDDLHQYPSSFSPDGKALLVTRLDDRRSGEPEAVALRFDGRPSSLLVGEGAFPVYSPDGSKVALIRERTYPDGPKSPGGWRPVRDNTDLYVIDADGTHLRRLTRTPRAEEVLASWDPSGQRLAYTVVGPRPFRRGSKSSIMQINADGTCPTEILSKPRVAFYGPVWQPGREAGPIPC